MKPTYCVLFALALAAGCRTSISTQSHYVLNAERAEQAASAPSDDILDVHRLTIDRTYDFKGLVYKKDAHEYEIDYYNGFLVSPSQMITDRVRRWLSEAGLFARVLDPASQAERRKRYRLPLREWVGDQVGGRVLRSICASVNEPNDPSSFRCICRMFLYGSPCT